MTEQRKKTPGELMAEQKVKDDAERARYNAERKAMIERTTANHLAAEAERERVRVAAQQESHAAQLKEALRQSYIQANGSESGFSEQFPKLREEYVRAQTLANIAGKPTNTREVVIATLKKAYGQ